MWNYLFLLIYLSDKHHAGRPGETFTAQEDYLWHQFTKKKFSSVVPQNEALCIQQDNSSGSDSDSDSES
jgi:hypothetical protein